jgi:hypothetical protein
MDMADTRLGLIDESIGVGSWCLHFSSTSVCVTSKLDEVPKEYRAENSNLVYTLISLSCLVMTESYFLQF